MNKSYIFIYDAKVGSRDEVKSVLEKMDGIVHWRYDIPSCFYVVSEKSAQELSDSFIAANGKKGRFMFMESNPNRQGLMLPETWYLLTHKTHKPKT